MTQNSKIYLDWEINSILAQLESSALEKGEARNRIRAERGESPVNGLEVNTLEWHAINVIRQLQHELLEMTDKKEQAELARKQMFEKVYIPETELQPKTFSEKKIPKRRVKTDPKADSSNS